MCVRPNHQVDSYDFHALDALQCMLERRNGGETGQLYELTRTVHLDEARNSNNGTAFFLAD
jgi:hypothetical protein